MIVKELILQLQSLDPEALVLHLDSEEGATDPVVEPKELDRNLTARPVTNRRAVEIPHRSIVLLRTGFFRSEGGTGNSYDHWWFMTKYKSIPIKTAKEIAEIFDKDQVIIVTWDQAHGRTHVTTYGKTLEECKMAAEGGNLVKKALGWPDKLCHDKPERVE